MVQWKARASCGFPGTPLLSCRTRAVFSLGVTALPALKMVEFFVGLGLKEFSLSKLASTQLADSSDLAGPRKTERASEQNEVSDQAHSAAVGRGVLSPTERRGKVREHLTLLCARFCVDPSSF